MNIRLKKEDIVISFLKGSGPGGQHKNKRETGVRIVHKPTGLSALATKSRSQNQNLLAAKAALREKIAKKLKRKKKRIKTKPKKSSIAKGIKNKKKRSETKKNRKAPTW